MISRCFEASLKRLKLSAAVCSSERLAFGGELVTVGCALISVEATCIATSMRCCSTCAPSALSDSHARDLTSMISRCFEASLKRLELSAAVCSSGRLAFGGELLTVGSEGMEH